MRRWTTECRRCIRQVLARLVKQMADDDSDQDAGKGCLLRVPEMLTQGCLPPGRGDGRGVDARGHVSVLFLLTGGSACGRLM